VYARTAGSASESGLAQTDHSLRVGGYLPIGGLHRPAHARLTPRPIAATQPDAPEPFTPVQPPAAVATSVQDAGVAATPVQGSLTTSGLPMRIPQANHISGPAGLKQNEAPQPSATRSAEAARARLSGLQSGTRRAEQRITRAGERADQERADH
jgi:hypothetical protein